MSETPNFEQLIENLTVDDQKVRLEAVKALAQLKDARAVEPLLKMVKIYDGESRFDAFRGQNQYEWSGSYFYNLS